MTNLTELILESVPNQKSANALMERVIETAKPESVFSKPVTQGEYMVITAAEVNAGLGFGYGGGGGLDTSSDTENDSTKSGSEGGGFGGGGGGGGGAGSRPVAVIEIGPKGVRVEPIVDPTKIVLAFLTTLGAMFAVYSRMRQTAEEMIE